MRPSRHVARVLQQSVTRELDDPGAGPLALAPSAHPDRLRGLCEAAWFHGVVGYAHRAVDGDERVPEEERSRLASLRQRAVFFHLVVLSDLAFLREVFASSGIPWLVVKGPTLAVPVHGYAELRSYSDIDVVVPAAQLGPAMDILERRGARVVDRNWELIEQRLKGEVHLELPSGTALDLHWHLLNDRPRRRTFPIDMDGLFQRAVTVDVGGLEVPSLADPDAVVYLALHTLHSGGHRLVWLKDLERLLTRPALPLDDVRERAQQWHAELVLATAIGRVRHALGGSPGGAALAAGVRGGAWGHLTSLVWRLEPAQRQDGSPSLGRIVANATREGQRASFAELVRRASARLVRRGGRASGERFDETDPRSGRYAAGGDAARHRYLAAVAGEAQQLR